MSPPDPHSAAAPRGHTPDDALTCAAIGSSAYILAALAHETIGHPLMALLQGGRIRLLTSVYMEATNRGRLIDLAGPLANLLLGFAFLFFLRRHSKASVRTRFFYWYAVGCNFLWATGYLMYSGVTGQGDFAWATVGLQPVWL